MKSMAIDVETRSSVDLAKAGAYKYASSPDFDILLFAVSINGGEVNVYDLANGEDLPEWIIEGILNPDVEKTAYNAAFERVVLSYWLRRKGFLEGMPGVFLDPSSWKCTMVLAAYNGLPLSLAACGAAMGLEQQKLTEGKDLIRYFCVPSRATDRDWNEPEHAPEKWELFKAYNKRDVEVEMRIKQRLEQFPVPDFVWEEYHMDQTINDRGVRIDRTLVEQALQLDDRSRNEIMIQMQKLTGLENPNSVPQLRTYLQQHGVVTDSLGKKDVQRLLDDAPSEIAPVLSLRLQLAKTSTKKYQAMINAAGDDDRCRGLYMFYGANRTGRFSSKLIQLQNLPKNQMPDLAEARAMVREGDYEMLEMLYPSIPGVLSELVRTALIPSDGCRFIVADFSAIEARVLAFLAKEQWRNEVFHTGGDIYCASASQMFGVKVEKHGINSHLRQKGKLAELSSQYGGSVGALKNIGALEMGLSEEDLHPLVTSWRASNPNIVKFWWEVDRAAKGAIRKHRDQYAGNIRFSWKSGMLFIHLPSGRRLSYASPRMGRNQFGEPAVTYLGTDSTKKWSRIETYGPKLVENIVQAISRDILTYAMKNLSGYRIVAHVHDEVIIEAGPEVSVEEVCAIMGQTPPWIKGLELRADGYECSFYMKD